MSSDLKRLYSEIIKEHASAPFHFEKISNSPIQLKAYNPICGDRFDFYISNQLTSIHFHGFGCAISKASSSIMVKLLEGKKNNEALELCKQFLRFVNKESLANEVVLPDELLAFSGVHDFPERMDCATLAWKEMEKYLSNSVPEK
ncbi:MAG: SUF system NifU family Fe-S cluster assembly protein [Cyclobacteriaceae bacterium]|nr:SUF system NifU family Fe-S cluster assembly protein [Cyclobacteriaceae bacterium]